MAGPLRSAVVLMLVIACGAASACTAQTPAPTPDVDALVQQALATVLAATAQAPTVTPIPTVTPTAAPPIMLQLQNAAVWADKDGRLLLSGEVVNTGESPITGALFHVSLWDDSGSQVTAGDGRVCYVEAGGNRPFVTVMGYMPMSWSEARIEFEQPEPANAQLAELFNAATISDVKHFVEVPPIPGGMTFVELQGKITNNGATTLPYVFIGGALYDKSGRVLSVIGGSGGGAVYDRQALPPGESAAWVVSNNLPDSLPDKIVSRAYANTILDLAPGCGVWSDNPD